MMIVERSRAVVVTAIAIVVLAAATGCASRIVGMERGAGGSAATTVPVGTTATSAPGNSAAGAAGATGALTVRVGISGGPMRADGTMALSNSPEPGVHLSATNAAGRHWTATTRSDGTVTMHLPAGAYFVTATCGNGPQPVTVTGGQTATLDVQCDVP